MATIAEIRQKFPQYSDISDGVLVRGLHKKFYSDMPYEKFLGSIDFTGSSVDPGKVKNPTEDMSTTQRVGAGAGKAFMDVGRGIGQMTGIVPQSSIDESKALDKPLMQTGGGIGGNILGNAALFAPAAFVPGANTYMGAGLIGAGMGAIQPVATGESRAANTALGGVAGIGGQAIGRGIGRVLKPVQSALSPEEQALAAVAKTEGIKLTAGQATGSRPLQTMESVMENLPLTAAPQLAGREAQQRAFTAAALKRAGMSGDVASAPAMLAQKQALGGRIGQIADQNVLDFNQGLTTRLADVVDDAAQHLPGDASAKVASAVDKILAQVTKTGEMSGTNYQGWREPLRGLASEGGAASRYFGKIRAALDESFRDQLQGATKAEVETLSRQYANLKTIINAMGGAGNLPAKGQIAPSQLGGAVGRAMGREGRALGRGDLNELSRAGQLFVREQIPNSGTPQRLFMQNLVTGNVGNIGGGLAGAGAGYYSGGTPESAALGGLLGVGGGLMAPRAIQALMNSGVGQSYLRNGLLSLSPEALNALAASTSLGAPAALLNQ